MAGCLGLVERLEPERGLDDAISHDGADDARAVAVVLGVVRVVDRGMRVRVGRGEAHVPLDATGPDASGTTALRTTEPRVAGAVGRADEEFVADAHHPDRHEGSQ